MRGVIVRSLAVLAVGGVALAGVLYVASTVDARPPEVLTISITQPVGDDARLALVNTSIEVEFSEPVDPDSAAAAMRIEPEIEGTTSWSGSTLIFTPADPLELDTAYEVHVEAGVRDDRGNVMEEVSEPFEFLTAGRPELVAADPEDGSDGVALDAPVRLVFSTLMDTASVEDALRIEPAVAHELRWSGEVLDIVLAEPLEPGTEYVVTVNADAADAAGVPLADEARVAFRTVDAGVSVQTIVPGDGVDGIAVATAVAVILDQAIDPASVEPGLLVVEPEVAGTLEVVALPGEEGEGDEPEGAGRMLRFLPSGALPPNTTFSVELGPGLRSASGGLLAEPVSWSFTTGPPPVTISNQVTFISDRAGIPNVWAMNPDGTGQRQLSAELAPVVDYAVAPDGSSLVVADGRRLVFLRADGDERRVLTPDAAWEFDPAYAPNGQRIAFGRADAETGEGLGIWTWEVGGGDPTRVDPPVDPLSPDASADADAPGLLRAPRYAPDGQALAFVDVGRGEIGMLELPAARFTRISFAAAAPPAWLPGSAALLVTGGDATRPGAERVEAPVAPLVPGPEDETFRLARSGTAVAETAFATGWHVLAVAPDGTVAFTDADGALRLTDSLDTIPAERLVEGERVVSATFSPDEGSLAIAVRDPSGAIRIQLLDPATGRRETLAEAGERPRWQP